MEFSATLPAKLDRTLFFSRRVEHDFKLYFDEGLSRPTPYDDDNGYLAMARVRIDKTFELIAADVPGSRVLDVGASPFYFLDKAKASGARQCHGIYFANDTHPLKGMDKVYSKHGAIEISHTNIETERFPFEDNSFDIITACEILEHCDYFPLHFGTEVRRILRPGGMLCITVPNLC